ncbi:TATA-box-binding protein [Halorarius halobius]|uniref:TATA-box-binding protein n=1 Tax=Halorarius halobius TaxID=2962671 RepID=UPI0020CC4CDE|nr:TATA-box-binding protein [Halorarius halobius]
MAAPVESLQIENVVTSTGIDQELDLDVLVDDLDNSEYNRDQFPGLIYRSQSPAATSLLFRSGTIVSTGASSRAASREAVTQLFEELRSLGMDVPAEPELTVQNVVSSGDLGQDLNLNAVAIGLGLEHVEYEPEQFPGLVYRLDDMDTVALLFGSGRVVITGAVSVEEAEETVTKVHSELTDLELMD